MKRPSVLSHRNISLLVGLLLCILLIIVLGCLFAPHLFYDQWIWKYYWGPVVADAAGHSVEFNGVVAYEGYTLVSEVTYGVLLIGALYGLYQLLKKLRIDIDWSFCVALLPYILFGPVTRVLEDTAYFTEPVVYWFISPLIYVQTTLYVLGFLLLGWYLRQSHDSHQKTFVVLLSVFVGIDCVYTLLWVLGLPCGIEPLYFGLLSVVAFSPLLYHQVTRKAVSINTVVFSGGLLVVLPGVFLIGQWIAGWQWSYSSGSFPSVLLLIICLVALIVGLVFLVAWRYRTHEAFAVYTRPLNLAMLSGHLIDGLTSYISIYDPLMMGLPSYIEKHPASNTLMELWPPLFPIVKFLLIMLVIYVFDVLYKKELMRYARLVNLLKIGIFILGVSPGLRDLLRVTMGV
ncbi:MAG: DUF63 family protein [Candidatus Thermoplasmatota archaeon]|nr:DUF63 family protein [Candidatus Thermoplasmatota archaeon]